MTIYITFPIYAKYVSHLYDKQLSYIYGSNYLHRMTDLGSRCAMTESGPNHESWTDQLI